LKHILVFILLLNLSLSAIDTTEQDYSLRVGYGIASENDLGEILAGDFGSHPRDLTTYSLDAGYLLQKELLALPLDLYIKSGISYFDEDEFSNTLEITLYVKLYWNIDFFDRRMRVGFGEGLSYTKDVLETEYFEAIADGESYAKFLNYLDISLDFDLGKLISYKPLYDTYLGYALKHRSGVFGTFSGVHGGSNYNTFYLEKNF